uniref:protein strawberry notch homolog 2-like isoform X1 n=1 Tax=Oncorhynchus gorbuscha TaxID=8017 RepID=UPI001EAEED52|nr:protein strawberry notch homolog 2-like isoform X1 [Oncorhynchus gorbuscha]XP_046157129.1 protein strawberry notch homolog 2-like isoform X1 [Oncorhynchus gorbuscha]XP_046157130.1 protein strawberry notch homolog 2-like isoform X1 [Oncorhynchus gorbuscha]XP_046157131.1 protein strawberry notch homolog 2-like isoform X1 [Oncorhynchus gorbuscha]XP_046157132.1 protein strawberry notch homolog 2-like isoform X1 [Oncorhynchus gorbuscha]
MPTLPSPSLAMDGENYLHPEGPQLDSSMFEVASSNMESSMYPSASWGSFSQQSGGYSAHCPMQSENQQYHLNDTMPDMHIDMFSHSGFHDDFPCLNLPRNGGFPQDLSCIDDLSNNSLFSSPADSLSEYADTQDFIHADNLAHVPTLWDINTPAQSQLELNANRFQGLSSLEDISAIISTPPLGGYQVQRTQTPAEEEEEEEETEELGHVDTYADYKPSKSTIGISHPDIVVETNTLSSVPPPDITYTLSIPNLTINCGLLSALQLEAIIYACQQHEVILQNNQRAGFLIGDGAGVGKGRTVAGIILENYLKGRKKALWFSVSNDLKYDAERDLKDINAPTIPVHALNKIKYGDTATSEGVLFATYSALIGESQAGGQRRTRLKQILDWCKPGFDGVIVFDECHKAKNATSTKMGKAVLDLQHKLPLARVVYASATGASEPKNMIYMSRLGIWGDGTPFKTFDDFLHAIEKRGVGAMEIVAMDMKVSGMYIARQLSFSGVSFRIEEISLDDDFKLVYNKSAKLWAETLAVFMRAADELCLVSRKSLWGQFWSSHQRFFKYLCIAAKVRCLVELANKELEAGKCIVIGLQSTGEARTREVLDENDGHLDRFVSAAEGVFKALVQKHFPSEKPRREKAPGNKRKRKPRGRQPKFPKHTMVDPGGVINISDDSSTDTDGMDTDSNSSPDSLLDNNNDDDVIFVDTRIEEMKQDLLNKIADLGKELPLNTLDELIDKLGGPEKVSEMTGRKGRVVRRPDGSVRYESRAEQSHTIDHINLKEKDRFMCGEKLVAIISEAASSGISLQADKRVKNQCRRVHMTLELPWSADRAIQQFGRTHRSNQVTAPEYIFLISELAGERRFASIVAKRLESLGALTHGDRRATESRDLSKYNFENKYGTKALDKITKAILGHIESKVSPPKGYPGGDSLFFRDMKHGMMDVGIFCKEPRFGLSTEKDCSITKFLNRILGLEVHKQNSLFQYFTDNFDYLIEKDKKEGKYDMGILDLAPGNDEIYEEKQETFMTVGNPQDGQVVLYKISVDRGMPWEEAYEKAQNLNSPDEGFYLSYKLRGNHPCVLLAEQGRGRNFIVYKPNIGKQAHPESLDNLQQRYRKVTPDQAKDSWESQFNFSFGKCSHANWNGKCKKIEEGQECLQGMRLRQYHMLCGALLRVWKRVADVVSDITSSSILQIVRLKTKNSNKQVGIKIPENCVARVRVELLKMDEEVKRRRKEREQHAQEQRLAEQRQLQDIHLLAKPYSQPHSLSQSHRTQNFYQSLIQAKPLQVKPLLQPKPQPSPINQLPSMASIFSHFPHHFPSLPPMQPAPTSTTKPFRVGEEVLDLTVSSSPSPDSTEGVLGLISLTGGSDFDLERLISRHALAAQNTAHVLQQPLQPPLIKQRQLQSPQQIQPQLQQWSDQPLINSAHQDYYILDHPDSLPYSLSSQTATNPSTSSTSSSSSNTVAHVSSPSTPSHFSSSALAPSEQQPLPLANSHCSTDTLINAREVLDNMMRTSADRQSVIQYQPNEWDSA